ncbi:hypothetical protein [Paenibacillus glucanolyticus]|uniref:hypothetical protein n=1 Tax=Paenibacillus glucanolyticus TaxID=59843 RepID=UPI00096C908C|nr:hypothetical protein [Paenibacillus glucanolyticus]OMF76699.1 hypothetical protein BK142_14350 [Paenibacillus glucanolyticus]
MISEKGYRAVQITKRTVKAIEAKLKENEIVHEPIDYTPFLFNSIGHTILTDNCTIEVYKNEITVNEKPVSDVYEMIDMVTQVAGK